MSRRRFGVVVVVAGVAVSAGLGASALAGGPAGGGAVVKTAGREYFRPNRFAHTTLHFAPQVVTVQSGATIAFEHADKTADPHTITISTKADVPTSFASRCKPCDIAQGHSNPRNPEGPPRKLVLNKGTQGLDEEGDSLFLAPKGAHKKISAVVSAPAGTTLYYICAIHPWMQGEIRVT